MQFKHPEILYFLFALLLPVLVHLFQLQKFKKIAFTNVAFLQKIVLQTRKSSKLKKWLILTCRMLLFSAVIFAFSQPYFSNENAIKKQHNFIYIDNSLSMNSIAEKGNIFQNAVKELIENCTEESSYDLLTNTDFYKNIGFQELKNRLLKLQTVTRNREFSEILLTINNQNIDLRNTLYNSILISDFQFIAKNNKINVTNVKSPISLIQTTPSSKNNVLIDSVQLKNLNTDTFLVEITLKNQGIKKEDIPISIFNEQQLLSKQRFSIAKNSTTKVSFPIQNQKKFNGRISLNLSDTYGFDNELFFTKNSTKKTTVLSIGKATKFLPKIFTNNEFEFSQTSANNINYNTIKKQDLIILNELIHIPKNLITYLEQHMLSSGSLVIIPNKSTDITSYNAFFKKTRIGYLRLKQKDTLDITNIKFDHPFFKNVFTKRVRNFQYPYATTRIASKFNMATSLIDFENNQAFVEEIQHKNSVIYWFAAPLSLDQSNFINSPLIVPLFHKIGKLSAKLPLPYYRIGTKNTIAVNYSTALNEIISLHNTNESFIPRQQSFDKKTVITTQELPNNPGFYTTKHGDKFISSLAFNTPKAESSLQFQNIPELIKNHDLMRHSSSIKETLQGIHKKNEVRWLWKWFLIIGIVSLFFEILILKLFKP